MGTLREDITEIRVGVATLVEHQKNVDIKLDDGEKRMDDHSKMLRKHDTKIIELESDGKTRKEALNNHSKVLKFVIIQGFLVLISIVGFLIKVIWEYVKTKGLPSS